MLQAQCTFLEETKTIRADGSYQRLELLEQMVRSSPSERQLPAVEKPDSVAADDEQRHAHRGARGDDFHEAAENIRLAYVTGDRTG